MTMLEIKKELTTQPKEKPAVDQLGFGQFFTDHMFIVDYTEGMGWHDPRIIPYQPLSIDPSAMVFHYGQAVFEGLKAYATVDNGVLLFRPDRNFNRLNHSNERIVIPAIDEELALEALKQLVTLDREWVPTAPGTSLYIRPFIIATEPHLGVHPSNSYQFIIIMSPSGSYYKEGINPVKIMVEQHFVRAVVGGTGEAKTAGNYASALKGQEIAHKEGYSQTLWLDGKEHRYIEEVGSMNIFFKINGTVITPALNGSILPGITRDSMLHVLKAKNIPVEERRISIDEVVEAYHNGTLEEAFGTGTAAVISPVGELKWRDEKILINNGEIGEISQMLYDTLTGIQNGTLEDSFGWTIKL
ncbi:branched-chain amino acid aminotransferase [Lysinibacillus sphaericus]|uniref:Branched-chain-amino-acid aminotransferase n=4 Tax=Lysinibacillus TaxID=400634 RepID=A0A2S0K304_LYSSH|nr:MULTISPECIES: branched-chain amino acid aminotransferase [Lysinibacillus]AVK97753.1 branched chain amino acid aminotransferase [Lysinibacillus sphaericus]MCS1382688.1 branched-chain amino acid aminotransferase [Lysinibacillus sphaericus]MED4543236.1 branched-chain amino acid aminotransferase [Lysinibacillus sphaericus]TKI20986.1 branched-chain amino acid aminotransferase [Lysinibacillus sphaericus]TKI48130.1 branched-chain amino acid aminotransferase [Lysinibacillus tabacifolii]